MELIRCIRHRMYFSKCSYLFLMYFNTVVESLYKEILLTGILVSWTISFTSLAAIKAASNSSLRIVNEGLLIGVNLNFANSELQFILPLVIIFIYTTASSAFSDASVKMCSSTGFVQKYLYALFRHRLNPVCSVSKCSNVLEYLAVLTHPNLCYTSKFLVKPFRFKDDWRNHS